MGIMILHSSGPCCQGGWLEAGHGGSTYTIAICHHHRLGLLSPWSWLFSIRQHTSGHVSFTTLIRHLGRGDPSASAPEPHSDPSSQGKGQWPMATWPLLGTHQDRASSHAGHRLPTPKHRWAGLQPGPRAEQLGFGSPTRELRFAFLNLVS